MPELVQSNEALADNLNDPEKFSEIGREFHHVLARGCGNHTMVVVMGSLEALWTSQEGEWFGRAKEENAFPTPAKRRAALNAHVKITEAIADGDVDRARRLAYKHIDDAHTHALARNPISGSWRTHRRRCRDATEAVQPSSTTNAPRCGGHRWSPSRLRRRVPGTPRRASSSGSCTRASARPSAVSRTTRPCIGCTVATVRDGVRAHRARARTTSSAAVRGC